jgi:hypothetical protein
MEMKKSSEKGQVLVLLVLAIVALLGFTALAIDGGLVYSDRRHAQNAADASSLAGGAAAAMVLENQYITYLEWKCNDPGVLAAQASAKVSAIDRATSNDFAIDDDVSDDHGVITQCGSQNNGGWVDNYIDVITKITKDTPMAFAQFVYNGPLRNKVGAVTRVRPQTPVALGHAVVALREDCPNTDTGGVHFDGTSEIIVNGGGIFSNACLDAGGTVDVEVNKGDIDCVGDDCYTNNGGASVSPAPDNDSVAMPRFTYAVPAPTCPSTSAINHSGSGEISPGNYTQIRLNSNNDDLVMKSGLYCITEDFVANGGSVTGNNVTIYILNGDFDVAGGVQVMLSAPPGNETDCADAGFCPPALPGVLIYLAEGNEGEVSLLGTSDSFYEGLVYAPDGTIEAGGESSELSVINAQLVADTVKLHGNTTVNITFDNGKFYQLPAMLELFK